MIKIKNNLIAILIALIGILSGYFIMLQWTTYKATQKIIYNAEDNNAITLEASNLMETNQDLRDQLNRLNIQINELKQSTDNRKSAAEAISAGLKQNQIIEGITKASGEGVRLEFFGPLIKTQAIDLINALRNIGAEAITINDKRFTDKDSIENFPIADSTVSFEIIGKKDILYEALTRKGGILEQIGKNNKVEKKEQLVLPAKQ